MTIYGKAPDEAAIIDMSFYKAVINVQSRVSANTVFCTYLHILVCCNLSKFRPCFELL